MTLFQRKFRIDEKHLFTRIMLLQLGQRYLKNNTERLFDSFFDIMRMLMLMLKRTLN